MAFTLALTDAQEALRDKTREFARTVIRPAAPEYDRAQELPRDTAPVAIPLAKAGPGRHRTLVRDTLPKAVPR